MPKVNKNTKQTKSTSKSQISHKKGFQKKKNLSFENFLQELQQELDSVDNQYSVEESLDEGEEEINNFMELVELLSPQEISLLLNSLGGNFSKSDGKAIKKFMQLLIDLLIVLMRKTRTKMNYWMNY
jgi:hypothetical protein